jgi:hypothetical protein
MTGIRPLYVYVIHIGSVHRHEILGEKIMAAGLQWGWKLTSADWVVAQGY